MYGPSGFFADIPEDDNIVSGDLELFRDSLEGFTVLYRSQRLGRFFVYKALKLCYRGIQTYEDLLRKDFEIGFSLQHPNICQYFAFVNHPDAGNCIVMEWIDGEDLGRFLAERREQPSAVTDRILAEVCDALSYLHRKQVIHRDLKLENIMVTFNGLHPKLIDFGLSDADSFAVLKMPAGTQFYASPELLAGGNVDSRTDIWSLGIIMQDFGRRYLRISRKCLRHRPEDRYQNAEAVAADIAVLGKGRGMWLSIVLALVAVFVVVAIVGRERIFSWLDFGYIGYQDDSLEFVDGRAASSDGLQSGSSSDVAGGPAVDDVSTGEPFVSSVGGTNLKSVDHTSSGSSSTLPSSSGKPDGSTAASSAATSTSKSPSPSTGELRTSLDSTTLDALFREAADELEVEK